MLNPKEMENILTFRVKHSRIFLKTFGAARQKITGNGVKQKLKAERRPVRAWLVSHLKNIYYTFRAKDWVRSAKHIVCKELKNCTFDCVYSSYPSYQTHLVAHYAQKKHIAGKWVADFRDPMAYMGFDKYEYKRSIQKQHRIERWADCVTVVSEGALEKFRFPDVPDRKLTYIPNGYDPEDFSVDTQSGEKNDNILRLFYAGTLYEGRRDLSILFCAIAELIEDGLIQKEFIEVEYAGNEWPVLYSFADNYGLAGICRGYGYVPRSQVMEIMAQVDITLVCSLNTAEDRGVVTGKLFELLLVEKPIIAIVNGNLPDSELAQIVRDCDAGVVFEEATAERDYPQLKRWLLEVYESKQKCGSVFSTLRCDKREQYSYETIAKHLVAIFDDLCDEK